MSSEYIGQWARMVETKDLSNPTLLVNLTEDVYAKHLVHNAVELMLGYLLKIITQSPYGWKDQGWGRDSHGSLDNMKIDFSRQGRNFDGYHRMKTKEHLEVIPISRRYETVRKKSVKGKIIQPEQLRPVKLFLFPSIEANYHSPSVGEDQECRYAYPITTQDFSTVGIDRALEEVDFKLKDINEELEKIAKRGKLLHSAKILAFEDVYNYLNRGRGRV